MLVLTRKQREDVIIADEITLFVDDILDCDGNHLAGARVRLGFECPSHISIDRGELRRRRQGGRGGGGKGSPPEPPMPGRTLEFSEGQVRLRIQVPSMVPVCLNGTLSSVSQNERAAEKTAPSAMVWHDVFCSPGDRLTICNNIVIEPISFHRFEVYSAPTVGS